jgi:hypothetical protein
MSKRREKERSLYEKEYKTVKLSENDIAKIRKRKFQAYQSKKTNGPSQQDKIKTKEQIMEKLKDFIAIDPKDFSQIKPGTFIRYIRKDGKYCNGGILMRNGYPTFWVLKNRTSQGTDAMWSVQLKTGNKYFMIDKERKQALKEEKDELYENVQSGKCKLVDKNSLEELIKEYSDMKKKLEKYEPSRQRKSSHR